MAHKIKCRVVHRKKRARARAGKAQGPSAMQRPGQAKQQAKVKSRVKRQRHTQPKHPKLKKRLKDHKAAGDRPRGCGDKPAPAEPSAAPGPAKRG